MQLISVQNNKTALIKILGFQIVDQLSFSIAKR